MSNLISNARDSIKNFGSFLTSEETRKSVTESINNLSNSFGTGDPKVDLLLFTTLASVLALGFAMIALRRRRDIEPFSKGCVPERLSVLTMLIKENKISFSKDLSELKGDLGFLQQELKEIRSSFKSVEQQLEIMGRLLVASRGIKSKTTYPNKNQLVIASEVQKTDGEVKTSVKVGA